MKWKLAVAAVLFLACSSDTPAGVTTDNPCAAQNVSPSFRFAPGSVDGHPDPKGAKAAGQARAGRIRSGADIRLPANGRNRVRVGDYLLANDKIAAYIGSAAISDGMSLYGGELLAVEPVAADGLPQGLSRYGETLVLFSKQTLSPETVTVLADGSDGKAAIIRASGTLQNVAFLEPFRAVLRDEYNFPAAIDYVLEPGAEKVTLRVSVMNTSGEETNFIRAENIGFFHYYTSQLFTESEGFGSPKGSSKWVAFDGGESAFAVKTLQSDLALGLEVSGFQYFSDKSFDTVAACQSKTVDYADVITASGGIDGLRQAVRRVNKESAWDAVQGTVQEEDGTPIAGATVHVLLADGKYASRVTADPAGKFTVHAPAGSTVTATVNGYDVPAAVPLAPGVAVKLKTHGTIVVRAREAGSGARIPVRVQVIPKTPIADPPPAFGVEREGKGRAHQAFAMQGDASLPVPPGEHRVIVSRGYEWEMLDQSVTVEAGKTVIVDAPLAHSVDSTGVLCADFHIHSQFSFDSSDTVREKVMSAVADGLDIPVSSEHEWIVDFQPTIEALGVTDFAFGFPSEELTTFTTGHFGVVPIFPRPEKRNNGSVQWIGRNIPDVIDEVNALPESPVLIVNHPSSDTLQGFFKGTGFDRATAKGSGEKGAQFSDRFGAIEVWNDSDFDANRDASVADWFALLNAGKSPWGVGNSDSHHLKSSPVGYPRNCLRMGHDDPKKLTALAVRDVLKGGHSTVSGGLYMTVAGPAGEGPGDTLKTAGGGAFKVTVAAPSWLSATSLEVIVDGATTQTIPLPAPTGAGPGKVWDQTVDVKPSSSKPRHWVVFHAKGPNDLAPLHPGRKPFAVSNPVFFQ